MFSNIEVTVKGGVSKICYPNPDFPKSVVSESYITVPVLTLLRKMVKGTLLSSSPWSYSVLEKACKGYLSFRRMPTKLSELNRQQRQSLATWLLSRMVHGNEDVTPSDDHAEEVVESETLTSEDVHGADDCAQDIEDAPEREDADGEEGEEGEEEGEEDGKEDGGNDGDGDGDGEDGGSDGDGDGTEGTEENKSNSAESAEDNEGTEENKNNSADDTKADDEEAVTEGYSTAELLHQLHGFIGEADYEKRESIMNDQNKTIPLRKELRHLIEKLAFERAPYGHTDEQARWDGKKLAMGRFHPHNLPVAKSGREKDHEIYFILDDSGSMYQHSQMFQGLLEASRHVVRLFVGSEAHPCKEVNGTFKADYNYSFARNLEIFLRHFRPAPGSVLLFWGDTCDMHIRGEESKVRALLRPFRAYWFGTYARYGYEGWEQPSVSRAGFRVIAPVTTPLELRQAIKKIK